jgi:hypothetical protein
MSGVFLYAADYTSTAKDGIRVFNHTEEWDKERHLDRGQARFDREQLPDLVEDGVQTEIELQREEIPKAVEALEDLKSNGADSIPADNG